MKQSWLRLSNGLRTGCHPGPSHRLPSLSDVICPEAFSDIPVRCALNLKMDRELSLQDLRSSVRADNELTTIVNCRSN